MFVLKFKLPDGRKFLLHDGEAFIGGNSFQDAEIARLKCSAVEISVAGLSTIEVTPESLAEMLGCTVEKPEYKILGITGGLLPFSGVEIVKENSAEKEQ